MMHALDLYVFFMLHGLSGRGVLLDYVIIFLAEYALYVLLAFIAYLLWRAWRAGRMGVVYDYLAVIFGALVARFGVAELIRFFYHRPRPYAALHLPHLLSDSAYSFPSGHTIFLFALATGVYRIDKKFAYGLLGLGVLVGLARVASGVHYPSDIVGGAVLGLLVGWVGGKVWGAVQRRLPILWV
ncbi:MAG: phosphatase PAP2 family protein [bacterium]